MFQQIRLWLWSKNYSLWQVHDTFITSGNITTQIIQTPFSATYFSIARTAKPVEALYGQPDQQLAIGPGDDIAFARDLVYVKGLLPEGQPAADKKYDS